MSIDRIVIVGGGTAGWMCAAALSQVLGKSPGREITLIESEAIGTVGVGEATVPSIREFNRLLRIDEDEFLRATNGSIKLGIEFVNWGGAGQSYFHPFGYFGTDMAGAGFHHHWLRHVREGGDPDPWAYNLEAQAAKAGRFARTSRHGPVNHAFHFDASLYAGFLREKAEERGVARVEGEIVDVTRDGESGHVASVTLKSGARIEGDFFIDCSGFRGLLIEGALESGYRDWSQWLPCDRAVAMPSENAPGEITPFTRSTARESGWQWRIPLQNRTGNGYVYCSEYLSDDAAAGLLASRLDGAPLAEPKTLRFTAGHRRKMWNGNVVALGLASGFLEPLESTSIYLAQMAITYLIELFPDADGIEPADREAFNRLVDMEYDRVRDFLILHYHATTRDDSEFWNHVRTMKVPDSLADKLELWRETGRIEKYSDGLFFDASWIAVYVGQGWLPRRHDARTALVDPARLKTAMDCLHQEVASEVSHMPGHREYLQREAARLADAS